MPEVKDAPRTATEEKPAVQAPQGKKGESKEVTHRAPSQPSLWAGDGLGSMRRFAEEIDRFFEDFGLGFGFGGRRPSLAGLRRELRREAREIEKAMWSPRVDILERGGDLVIRADLPGMCKDNVHVDITNDTLTIRGEREEKKEEKREGFYRNECSYGTFYREIPLPEGIDTAKASALMSDGVLEVTMPAPKKTEARGRQVEVKEASKSA